MITTLDPSRAHQTIRLAGERVQRVGVEHERDARTLEQGLHERRRARRLAETWPDGDDIGLELEDAIDAR